MGSESNRESNSPTKEARRRRGRKGGRAKERERDNKSVTRWSQIVEVSFGGRL